MAVYEVDSLSITQGENTYNIHTNPGATFNVEYDSNNKKLTKTINGTTSDVVTVATLKSDMDLAKGDVGLGNVENKSSSTIRSEITSSNVTTALGYTPVNESTKGVAGGVAELDENGRVPSSQLPSYVDDVIEYSDISKFPSLGEKGKIYVDISTNKTYRWGGETYVEISESLALGNTSSTAFRGDYGSTAYNHAISKGSAFNSGLYKITTNSEGHVTNATAVAKSDITGLGIPAQDTTYSNATTSAAGLMSADDKTKLNGIASGATANVGTITGITMNGTSKGTSGVVDLGTVITSHQDISGKVSGPASATNNAVAIFDGTGGKTIKNSGFTIGKSVPSDAKFTDTTYSNATTSAAGLMSADDKTKLDGVATGATANVGTITGIKMNGASKGTSGVVDLGTVITSHQDISGKADKSSTVSNVSYDSTNNKITKTINGTTSDVVTAATLKTAMSLGNVENKSSTTIRSEITSSNVTTALGFTPMNASLKGANNGVAELDSSGKVPASQLPSYVDDVLEYDKQSSFPATGETGKIYVAKDTNKTYRWSGTAYVEISPSLALGETSSTAYRGDRGKTAYDHASAKGSAFAAGLYKITTNSEGHVTAATAVAKSDITGLGIPGQDTTYSSKAAASGGTDISLVTTGEKAIWNAKTSNTGTVTSVAASGSGGITISGSPVTTSGTISIGLNLNTAINGLSTGDSIPADNDYIITQYANGGTTTTTYHRRPISKIWDYIKSKITKTVVTDALGYTPPTTDTNTHRPIQVNGTEILGNNTTALNLKAGSNVSMTNSSGTVTIAATDTKYSAATQSSAGLMSATDKTKLDGIATGATANVGTITGIKMNGASKGTSGVVDLGTVITAHQNISGKADKVTNATSGNFAALDASGNLTDSGKKIVTSVSSSDNTNAPTSKAVATYVSDNSVNAYVSGTTLVLY